MDPSHASTRKIVIVKSSVFDLLFADKFRRKSVAEKICLGHRTTTCSFLLSTVSSDVVYFDQFMYGICQCLHKSEGGTPNQGIPASTIKAVRS